MKDFNWLSNWADRTKVRNTLSYETFRDAGSAYHLAFPIRIQQNGQFFSIADFVEDGDDRFLERIGRNPEGALYKIYNTFTTVSGQEKKSRRWEAGTADLQAFLTGVNLTGTALTNFLYDNVNLPSTITYLAGMVLTENTDCCHKNHYLYRDVPVAEGAPASGSMPWTPTFRSITWTGPADRLPRPDLVWDGGTGGNNNLISKLFAIRR
jgi:spore coat protein CotH